MTENTDNDILLPDAKPVLRPFSMTDPFNNNEVTGFIHIEATALYGALEIKSVNGLPAEQLIWATPKLRYPFGGEDRKILNLSEHAKIECFCKMDGTNVIGFIYHDAGGTEYVSYKTRLMPFIHESRFGQFLTMWREMLARYPCIPDSIRKFTRGTPRSSELHNSEGVARSGGALSFEMYGKRNKILLIYDTPLDIVLLFGVKPGQIYSPTHIECGSVPKATLIKEFYATLGKDAFAAAYTEVVDYLNKNLKVDKTTIKSDDGVEVEYDLVQGMEGAVWYLTDANGIIQNGVPLKCKPDYVFDICTAGSIPMHSIKITIQNALEQDEPITFELIKRMLMEEYPEDRVLVKEQSIRREIAHTLLEQELLTELVPDYIANKFDINTDKRTCMTFFGKKHSGKNARLIFRLLMQRFGACWP